MKNSEMPAMPVDGDLIENLDQGFWNEYCGLTKREYFAGLALQGWLARCANVPHFEVLDGTGMAKVAVGMADALLAELDNEVSA